MSLINFKNIKFPESDGENVLKSLGISEDIHNKLFKKFLDAGNAIDQKSRIIKNILKENEFTKDELKLIFLLAYDRAAAIIQAAAEKEFSA